MQAETTEQKKAHTAVHDDAPAVTNVLDQSEKIGSGMQVGIDAFGAWAIGVGSTIGSYAFLIHGSMIAQAGPLASVLSWLAAAAMSVPLALLLAELSSLFPSAGGPYVYKYFALKRLIPGTGEMFGFLTGCSGSTWWSAMPACLTGLPTS